MSHWKLEFLVNKFNYLVSVLFLFEISGGSVINQFFLWLNWDLQYFWSIWDLRCHECILTYETIELLHQSPSSHLREKEINISYHINTEVIFGKEVNTFFYLLFENRIWWWDRTSMCGMWGLTLVYEIFYNL